jgi:hypothetical protein
MPFDLPAEQVLPLLESHDRARMDARSAWDWLTGSGDVPVVTLHDLEYFLWYQLPAKFLTGLDHHRAVALALGDLLGELGYEDGAALCRGQVTMDVLEEWAKGDGSGFRAFRKSMEESGVEPPDTDTLAWGGIMGMVEAGVFHAASTFLEDALAEGEFTPGARGWRQAQGKVMRGFLTRPLHSLDESTPQEAVWAERRRMWADEHETRPLRRALMRDVDERIRRPRRAPATATDHLRPLQRILEIAAAGPSLTQAGYIPPRLVQQLVRELGWEAYRPPRSEADAPEVMMLMAFAKEAGLVRRFRGSLRLTELGRRGVADPAVLWEGVVRALAAGADFVSATRELLLIRLLRGASEREAVEREIRPVLSEAGWKPSGGGDLTRDMVAVSLWDAVRPMDLLRMLDVGERPERSLQLTEFGTASALAVLWHRATAPKQSIE